MNPSLQRFLSQASKSLVTVSMLTGIIATQFVYAEDARRVETVTRSDRLNSPSDPEGDAAVTREIAVHRDADQTPGTDEPVWGPLEILGATVAPNTRRELRWNAGQSFDGSALHTPVLVIRGIKPGPSLCLTAAVHGDELNGVEIVRRVLNAIKHEDLAGTVIGVPIVNLLGFSRASRYLPDRRDLNRYFPGRPNGSSASRIAYGFFDQVVRHCDRLVDLHTGSFKRTNLPQLRADLRVASVRQFVERFGATAVLHKVGGLGTLRHAATNAGIPTVAFELGEPGTLQLKDVEFGVKALDTLLDNLEMTERFNLWSKPQPIFYRSQWLRAYRGGILTSTAKVGARIRTGDLLGVVTNPVTNESTEILSPHDGRLLGRALNQFVLPGFATFHVGIEAQDASETAGVDQSTTLEPRGGASEASGMTRAMEAASLDPIELDEDVPLDDETH